LVGFRSQNERVVSLDWLSTVGVVLGASVVTVVVVATGVDGGDEHGSHV
jgi:hypothetical protein